METSTMTVAIVESTEAIEILSSLEIEQVSGGKSAVPPTTKGFWESVLSWITGGGDAPPAPPAGIEITGAQLVQMQNDCVSNGGSWSFEAANTAAGGMFDLVAADGSRTSIKISCVK